MNEEETINILEDMLEKAGKLYEEEFYTLVEDKHMWAVRGLLSLYQKEKEKNIKLEEQRRIDENSVIDLIAQVNDENERCWALSTELDEANNVINLMAEDLKNNVDILFNTDKNIKDIKAYYFNKVKESKNE